MGQNRDKHSLKGYDYLVLDKKEIDSAKSNFTKLIELNKFAKFFLADLDHKQLGETLCPPQKSSGDNRTGSHRKGDHEH